MRLPTLPSACHCLAAGALALAQGGAWADAGSTSETPLESITVQARHLDEARASIQTQTGASTYTLDATAIAAMPVGESGLLNQVALQAPDVAQDSFGQFHVRGEHNGLQYRINGIILPEGISGFGQALDPRLVSSLTLVTGALPAEYGLRTAGIIDISTKSGALYPGGSLSLYGGSHGTLAPSIAYGGGQGQNQYFVSADALVNDLGIESPDGRSTALHDRTRQQHVFAYFEHILDGHDRITLISAASAATFQIPDRSGIATLPGYGVNGITAFDSANLDETQAERTQFAVLGWQHAGASVDLHSALTVRNSTLQFTPDPVGDLLFNGIAQQAFKRNLAFSLQSDLAWRAHPAHTLRAGLFLQEDNSSSRTASWVLPADANGNPVSQAPFTIVDDGAEAEHIGSLYLQDEWLLGSALTLNYGLRLDTFRAYAHGSQASPRVNAVWKAAPGTTVHAGYARYFSPPPFELVGERDISRFALTTAQPAVMEADTPRAERAGYTDLGVLQAVGEHLTLGLDSYFKRSHNLIDEGQFGAPIILTPFNYSDGRQYGAALSANWNAQPVSAYANLAWQSAMGRGISSAQFNFSAAELAYIANQYIALDHQQRLTASGGASVRMGARRLSADFVFGSGLRAAQVLPDGSSVPNGSHLPAYLQVNVGAEQTFTLTGERSLTAKVDVVNLLDRRYAIRDGTGVGVGAPQFGPGRGIFLGLSYGL